MSSSATLVVFIALLLSCAVARPVGFGEDGGYEPLRRDIVKGEAEKAVAGTNRPLIGILTQPCHQCPGNAYIAAANVKWIEMAGGRPVPISYNASDEELWRLFSSVNGLLFPGGLTWLWLDSPYVITARKLYNWAVEANDNGTVFPIHGICLGHQLLHILTSNVSRNELLVDTDAVQQPSTLEFTAEAKTSTFFRFFNDELFTKVEDPTRLLALQNHMYGIPPPHYQKWPVLNNFFSILSTSKDRKGQEYVSTVEAKNYPFTGTQWHPEKPPFEFALEAVPHNLDAILVSQALANAFIDTARKNTHKVASKEEELAMLIYSTPPVFSARFETFDAGNYDGPDMTYYFGEPAAPKTPTATT